MCVCVLQIRRITFRNGSGRAPKSINCAPVRLANASDAPIVGEPVNDPAGASRGSKDPIGAQVTLIGGSISELTTTTTTDEKVNGSATVICQKGAHIAHSAFWPRANQERIKQLTRLLHPSATGAIFTQSIHFLPFIFLLLLAQSSSALLLLNSPGCSSGQAEAFF